MEIPVDGANMIDSEIYRHCTLFESENERQKIEPVPIPLHRASHTSSVDRLSENFDHKAELLLIFLRLMH